MQLYLMNPNLKILLQKLYSNKIKILIMTPQQNIILKILDLCACLVQFFIL